LNVWFMSSAPESVEGQHSLNLVTMGRSRAGAGSPIQIRVDADQVLTLT
jgi:hypothetical protein